MSVRKTIPIQAVKTDGSEIRFDAMARLDTDMDVVYYENGGILPYVLRKLMAGWISGWRGPPDPGRSAYIFSNWATDSI